MLNPAVVSGALNTIERYEFPLEAMAPLEKSESPIVPVDSESAKCVTFDDFSIYPTEPKELLKSETIENTETYFQTTRSDFNVDFLTSDFHVVSGGDAQEGIALIGNGALEYGSPLGGNLYDACNGGSDMLPSHIETSDISSTSESDSDCEPQYDHGIPTLVDNREITDAKEAPTTPTYGGSANLLKQTLKDKIRQRRESEGRPGEIPSNELFEPPKQYPLTPEEQKRNEVRKARNRKSATKSRLKRIAREGRLEKEAEEEEEKNSKLMKEIALLRGLKKIMMSKVATHVESGQCKKRKLCESQNSPQSAPAFPTLPGTPFKVPSVPNTAIPVSTHTVTNRLIPHVGQQFLDASVGNGHPFNFISHSIAQNPPRPATFGNQPQTRAVTTPSCSGDAISISNALTESTNGVVSMSPAVMPETTTCIPHPPPYGSVGLATPVTKVLVATKDEEIKKIKDNLLVGFCSHVPGNDDMLSEFEKLTSGESH